MTPQLTVEQALGLAIRLQQTGRSAEAELLYRQVLKQHPNQALALHDLGTLLHQAGRRDEAVACWTQALSLRPDLAEAHYNLANVWRDRDRLDEAIASYRQTIALRPTFAPAWTNLANALRATGLLSEAMAAYREAMELDPDPRIASSFIFSMQFHWASDSGRIVEQCAGWNDAYARPLMPLDTHIQNDRTPERRLRIGYVSPDFRRHSQSQFTVPLLSHHDHERFEVFCYSDVAVADSFTDRIRGYADAWHDVVKLSDQQVSDLILQHGIDILVDLTMHMDRNRLLVFARKPAPIQMTWLAYPGTTGLTAIDYRLSDPYLDPPGQDDHYYSEKTLRLPDSFWCYDPLASEPEVNLLPASRNGYVTFGCLNNFAKVNDVTLGLWARVMDRVSNSRLILLAPEGGARERVLQRLQQKGIENTRVEFVGRRPRTQYLECYHRIDLCVDTYPYNGHTTTLDALWMGVPTVTLVGQTGVSRGGLSILSNIGLQNAVAHARDDYVRIAARFAEDLSSLAQLRSTLRNRMRASPLMDANKFARGIEAIYRRVGRQWCETGPPA